MTALIIILCVLALLFLIMLIRVEVFLRCSEQLTLVLKILFVKITLVSPDKKPKKKPKKSAVKKKPKKKPAPKKDAGKKAKKPSYLARLREKKGLSGLVSLLASLARIASGALKGLFSHTVIMKLDVGIALSGEDAATVAVNYGRLCAAVYPAVNVIAAATICRDYHVSVEPVFDPDRPTEFYADIHAGIRVIFALAEAVKAAVRLLIVRIKL